MGQKTNPNIFRLGVNKTWKTEFFEKKKNELPLYTFKDLEIKDYIERFFNMHEILLHDYKQHYSNSTLNLYISYFVTPNFTKTKSSNATISLIDQTGNQKKVIVENLQQSSLSFVDLTHRNLWKSRDTHSLYKLKRYFQSNHLENDFKQPKLSDHYHGPRGKKTEGVLRNMFKVLSLFTSKRVNISVNFRCINKDFNFLKFTQKRNFILLQKFRHTSFLKDGIELLFYVVCTATSANLLAKFIAVQIQKTKRHKFLLSFLKQSLTIMLSSPTSKVKGVKIIIKGRLNGAPRAKHKIIVIGDVPVQSISENVDYAQTTVHNSNGSYGVKTWVVEK